MMGKLVVLFIYNLFVYFRLEALMGLDRSHIQDETLRHASWYQAGIPR